MGFRHQPHGGARWQAGVSLYDRAVLHQLAVEQIADNNSFSLFNGRFTSFVGLPTTAMLHLPFVPRLFKTVLWYRVSTLPAMLLSVFGGLCCAASAARRGVADRFFLFIVVACGFFSLRLGQKWMPG